MDNSSNTDPRQEYVVRLLDAWRTGPELTTKADGDGGGTIAEGLAKARRSREKIVIAKADDGDGSDPREQWIGHLTTGWKN
jgi:hypothetical protein